ncbi:acyltransferase [Citreimonas sp.]|uniref:acyltransferase n=1 Tax=Citreimonas sp. TaxID=3036715 RepID=UPI0035C7F46D
MRTRGTTLVRGFHAILRRLTISARLLYYQATVFAWHRAAPAGTKVYGRLRVPHVPCALTMGRGCGFGHDVVLSTGRSAHIRLGDEVTINDGCLLIASEAIEIGDRVAIGEYVSIRDQQHIHVPGKGVRNQGFDVAPVRIGSNTWIGRGVFIGPGTRIGADCIVAANSVVHGTFPDGVLIAGAPAVTKKSLVGAEVAS